MRTPVSTEIETIRPAPNQSSLVGNPPIVPSDAVEQERRDRRQEQDHAQRSHDVQGTRAVKARRR